MVSGDKAALESLRKNFEQSMKNRDLEEAEAMRRAETATKKLEEASEKVVDSRIKSLKKDLPAKGKVKLAIMIALLADIIGLGIGVASYFLPWVAAIGLAIDAVTMFLLITLLGGIRPEMKWLLLEFSEAIPFGGAVQGIWFGYSFAVRKFWKNHEAEYGEWSDLMKSKTDFKNIFAGKKVNFGKLKVPSFAVDSIVPILLVGIIILGSCSALSVFAPQMDSVNQVGVIGVNINPWAKAYKESGRGQRFADIAQVEFSTQLQNFNPLRAFWDYYNQSVQAAGGSYYTTRVEENQGENLGLRIGEMNTLAYNQKPRDARFSFVVSGKTFTQSNLTAKTYCRLEKPRVLNNNLVPGTVSPPEFRMIKELPIYNIINCEVETEDIDAGAYQAVGGIQYPFEVWSYIPYTFVSRATFESYGENINSQLGIKAQTESLSTNGPMVLAISQLAGYQIPQPYVLYDDYNNFFPVDFKLQNNANGKIKDLEYVIFLIPKEFEPECFSTLGEVESNSAEARNILEQDLEGENNPLNNLNLVYFHDFDNVSQIRNAITFQCNLKMDPGDVSTFLNSGAVTRKTFVATAKYTYELERRKTIEILEEPNQ